MKLQASPISEKRGDGHGKDTDTPISEKKGDGYRHAHQWKERRWTRKHSPTHSSARYQQGH